MMINHMIKNFLGISSDLDKTLSMLANSIEDSDKAKLLLVVEQLKERLKAIRAEVTELRLRTENVGATAEKLESHRNGIRLEFAKNPQIIYWYEKSMDLKFFQGIRQPDVRVAIVTEVIAQAKNRWPEFEPADIWTSIIATQGLLAPIDDTDADAETSAYETGYDDEE